MPTGYTAEVQDGTVTEFRDFAFRCARGMGALIMMRDDPWDAPIPERFEPHLSYQDGALAEARARLDELRGLSGAQITEAARAAHDKALASHRERIERRRVERARYETMLDRVLAWTPPTDEHQGLKDFMAEQLRTSINFDCNDRWDEPPKAATPEEWLTQEQNEAARLVAYHTDEREKEITRTEGRNRWLAALRASLPAEVPA